MSIDAMKQALEVLEQLQGGCTDSDDGTVEAITVWCPEVIDALRAAIEQAPWVKTYAGGKPNYTTPEEQTRQWQGLTAERPEQPIECMCGICKLGQRQWQGLTDDEIAEVRHLYDGTAGWTIERFARAIEAKLKEKNK